MRITGCSELMFEFVVGFGCDVDVCVHLYRVM